MARQQPRKTSGHRKAIPRDMQDQQAGATPRQGPGGPETSRSRKGTENVKNSGERTGGTGGSREPRPDEPPD
ncbi:hypothetical protein [Streptomyces sp. NPDC000405]|uniref:hypothetical protein n=1 Tax=Streptomyces sp. NPDC000405 TaxID=3161033 RepID=UPI00398CC5F8